MKIYKLVSLLLLVFATPCLAGQWHIDSSLVCQNCHLQHSSQGGEPLPGGPFSYLLLKSTINDLCLSCHDGTDPTAPDVLAPTQMYQSTASQQSAGGWFVSPGIDNMAGHNLGLATVTPLQTESSLAELSCASCHAVHGNGNYRNLLYDPAGRGDSISVVEGTEVFTQYSPDKPPTISGSIAAYSRDNVAYKDAMAAWCSSCHDELTVNAVAALPAHFNAHPSNVAIDEYPSDAHADAGHWMAGLGEGFVEADGITGIQRVPFQAPLATTFNEATTVDAGNQVFCGSCHKAHGGQYRKAVLWPYLDGGLNLIAGCQQCHNK